MEFVYGVGGALHYIRCLDTDEIYGFGSFGTLETSRGLVSNSGLWTEVDCLSVIPTTNRTCEVFYNGKVCDLSISKQKFQVHLINRGKYLNTVFHITHEDELGSVPQAIFVYRKGDLTLNSLETIISTCKKGDWREPIKGI